MALRPNQVKDVIATALIKAWEDDNFKENFLASPIETIEKLAGERLSLRKGIEIRVFETAPKNDTEFALESNSEIYDEELTEEELDIVSGGSAIRYYSEAEFKNFLQAYL